MKKLILLLLAATTAFTCAAVEHIWDFKDGSGCNVCKDSGTNPIALEINTPEKISWAREDDRGWFLNVRGGCLRAEKDKMAYANGVVIHIRFAASFETEYKKAWMPLVTCGNSYRNGYAIWVNQNGALLACFPGNDKWFNQFKAKINHLADNDLKVIQGNNRTQIILNDRVIADFACKGDLLFKNDRYFIVGSTGGYEFHGNLYMLSVDKFTPEAFMDGAPQPKAVVTYPAEEIVPVMDIDDPAGTVIIRDFSRFEPAPLIKGAQDNINWVFRSTSGFFEPQAPGSLHCPVAAIGDAISFNPHLNGKYNIYLAVRAVTQETEFSFAIGDTQNPYNVYVGAAGPKIHRNTEILIDKTVDMTGKKIFFLPGGQMVLGYVKFIPAENPRVTDYPAWNCVKITRGRIDRAAMEKKRVEDLVTNGHFKIRTYVDDAPLPDISDLSRQRGFILEKRNWMDLAFEVCKPATDSGTIMLEAAAAPGEYEPVTFTVHGLEDIGDITLAMDEAFAASGITSTITVARSIAKRTTNYHGASEIMTAPQYLERTHSTELKKGMTRQFWITLKVADNAKPGKVQGKMHLSFDKGKTDIPLTVTVYPFRLDDHDRLIGFFPGPAGFFDNPQLVRSMAEHNMNMFFVNTKLELPVQKDKNGDLYVDFSHAGVIDTMRDSGMKALVVRCDSLAEQSCKHPQKEEVCRKLTQSILAEAQRRSWGNVMFYCYDEALSRGKERLEASIWANRIFREEGAKTFSSHIWYKTSRPYQAEVDRLAPNISFFINRYNTRNLWYVDNWETMETVAKERGCELGSYNIDNAICFSQPAMWRFAMGWFFRTLGKNTRCQSVYAYNNSSADPYNDLDGGATDWMYDYPTAPGHKGGFSINYEAMREGVDDLRYIVTLENRIQSAKAKKQDTTAAESLLADIKNSFDFTEHFKRSIYLDSFFDKKKEEHGKLTCSGTYNLLNGWSLSDYQIARTRIADAIMALDEQLTPLR